MLTVRGSGFDPATLVTISNNMFDGKTDYSASCNGHHYWAFLFTGEGESITLTNNHIYYTSGRGPHIGGLYNSNVHIVNSTLMPIQKMMRMLSQSVPSTRLLR
jgi:pectin lyase